MDFKLRKPYSTARYLEFKISEGSQETVIQLNDGECEEIRDLFLMDYPLDTQEKLEALMDAVRALQDPEGHIYHGQNGECTGECQELQAALSKAEG